MTKDINNLDNFDYREVTNYLRKDFSDSFSGLYSNCVGFAWNRNSQASWFIRKLTNGTYDIFPYDADKNTDIDWGTFVPTKFDTLDEVLVYYYMKFY